MCMFMCVCWLPCFLRHTPGKHDGTLDGIRYFVAPPGCGSFVHAEKLGAGVSFLTAVKDRYCSAVSEAEEKER
jgi:hypothetical protein